MAQDFLPYHNPREPHDDHLSLMRDWKGLSVEAIRVLIAEDNEFERSNLRHAVEQLGLQVVGEASNGAEAVQVSRKSRPDVAILDIRMPMVDGIDAARMIVGEHPCALIFLSAYSENDLLEQAGEAGALAYLIKPFRLDSLRSAIKVAVKRFKQLQQQHSEIDQLKEALETRKVIERAKGLLMMRENLSEEAAFRKIHFKARNQNRTMKEIALEILAESETGSTE